jgi:hypothetical protein
MTVRAVALAFALTLATAAHADTRLHCTLAGKPMADLKERAGQYRVRLTGEKWSAMRLDEVGPMMVMLWAGGARCGRR